MTFRKSSFVLLLVAATLAAGGCGFLKKKSSYERARDGRSLEIPPDLEAPSTASALTIPSPGTAAGSQAIDATVPAAGEPAPASAPASAPPSVVAGEDATLRLTDSPAGAYRRVALALERSQVGEILARDESAATVTVRGTTTRKRDEGGLLKRMFTREKSESATVEHVVRVVPQGEGSEVRVEDAEGKAQDDEFARRIISALKQRLG